MGRKPDDGFYINYITWDDPPEAEIICVLYLSLNMHVYAWGTADKHWLFKTPDRPTGVGSISCLLMFCFLIHMKVTNTFQIPLKLLVLLHTCAMIFVTSDITAFLDKHLKWLKAANLSNRCIHLLGIIFFDSTSCGCAGMMGEVTWGHQRLCLVPDTKQRTAVIFMPSAQVLSMCLCTPVSCAVHSGVSSSTRRVTLQFCVCHCFSKKSLYCRSVVESNLWRTISLSP